MYVFLGATFISMFLCKMFPRKKVITTANRAKKNNMKGMLVVMLPIFIIIVFRWNVLPDTIYPTGSYYQFYLRALQGDPVWTSEALFYLIFNLMAALRIPWFLFLAILATQYVATFTWFIQKHSRQPAFSILLFTLLGLLWFPMGALRQAMAECFILLAYDVLLTQTTFDKKSIFKIAVFLLSGMLCHNATVLFAGAVLVTEFLVGKKISIFKLTFAAIIMVAVSSWVGPAFVQLMEYTRFRGYKTIRTESTFAISYILLSLFIILTILPVATKIKNQEKGIQFLVSLHFVFAVIMAYSSYLIDPFRVIHMFTPGILILAPIITRLYDSYWLKISVTVSYIVVTGILFWNTCTTSKIVYQSVLSCL